jgi:hypothetical protein
MFLGPEQSGFEATRQLLDVGDGMVGGVLGAGSGVFLGKEIAARAFGELSVGA